MRRRLGALAAVFPIMALLWPAAGTAQSWERLESAGRDQTIAQAQWPNGLRMVARCSGGTLDVMMTLARVISAPIALVRVSYDEAPFVERAIRWRISEAGNVIYARRPATFSRGLMTSEVFDLEITAEGAPVQRYELDSPLRPEVLGEVLSACNHPLELVVREDALITEPDWLRRPSVPDLARHFPARAAEQRISGQAEIECRVDRRGRVDDCIVLSESPEGEGFGAATVAIAQYFLMTPRQADGQPLDEGLVAIPIRWLIQ